MRTSSTLPELLIVVLTIGLASAAEAASVQPAEIARQGSFVPMTDVNERDANGNRTNSHVIERFEMARDGSAAVYAVTENPVSGECSFARQIRRVDLETGQDDRVGVTENLTTHFDSFDISDDGSRIVYVREDTTNEPEIVRNTCALDDGFESGDTGTWSLGG